MKSPEDSASAIWIPIVSVVTVLFVSAIIGLIIFLYSRKKCVTSKKSQHLEKNYDLPYQDEVYSEYEQYDGVYEDYQK